MIPRKISVIGLGYVGLTIAAAFSRLTRLIAFDSNAIRIFELKNGHDKNQEVTDETLKAENFLFTEDPNDLKEADFHIVTVPTPLNTTKHPDFTLLFNASELLGKILKKGDIIVYESTVYPGVTEEKCIPLLEKYSKLRCGKDFSVGYSPERINPADKEHTLKDIVKIVAATDEKTREIIADVYKTVVNDVFPVSSIKIAEASKIIENTQRDVNIALINEIAIMLHHLGLQTTEVIEAMQTKWNYLPFKPGLVGGRCIGVNSYYLMHKMEELGYYSDMIQAARRVNESIGKFIAEEAIKKLIHLDIPVKKARIAILGLTYKENCSDLRDTRVMDIIRELRSYGNCGLLIHDPIADSEVAKQNYGIKLQSWENLQDLDVMIFAVAHQTYLNLSKAEIKNKFNRRGLLMDIKNIFCHQDFSNTGILLWRL